MIKYIYSLVFLAVVSSSVFAMEEAARIVSQCERLKEECEAIRKVQIKFYNKYGSNGWSTIPELKAKHDELEKDYAAAFSNLLEKRALSKRIQRDAIRAAQQPTDINGDKDSEPKTQLANNNSTSFLDEIMDLLGLK